MTQIKNIHSKLYFTRLIKIHLPLQWHNIGKEIYNDYELIETPCSIQNAFRLKRIGALSLEFRPFEVCSQDVFSKAKNLEASPGHDYYYGKTALKLTHLWQPLPSLSAQEVLTHFHIEQSNVAFELEYSLRDNQYYIRGKTKEATEVSIDFLLKVPQQIKTLPPEIQALVDEFAGSPSKPGFGRGELKIAKENPTGKDYMNAILDQKVGRCEQRVLAFKHLMKERYPHIPVRMAENGCHMQVEVFIDGEWILCDLGGYPAKLNLDFKNDPRLRDQSGLQNDLLGTELIEDGEQIVQFLQSWIKAKQPELSLDAYCQQVTEPKQQKKYLIELNNTASVQALSLALEDYCAKNNRPFFPIESPDDLVCSAPFLTNQNNRGIINDGPGGPLHTYLTKSYDKANPPILIINADKFGTDDLVQHNSLFDEPPKVDGTPLPEGTIVILLRNINKHNFILGEDLSSRMDVIETCPVTDRTLNMAYPPLNPKPVEGEPTRGSTIELFQSENWKTLLLGQWVTEGNDFIFEEGQLQKVIREHKLVTVSNGLWNNDDFQNFWKKAKRKGYINYEGQQIVLPEGFDLVTSNGYDWTRLARAVEFKSGINPKVRCLNPSSMNLFIGDYEHIEASQGLKKKLGLIQGAAGISLSGNNLVVNLTASLTKMNGPGFLLSVSNMASN